MKKQHAPNPGQPLDKKEQIGIEKSKAHKASIGLPPLQRVKRAPGEMNPRKGKRGGLHKGHNMIERRGSR
jgi:hypothetical protein